MIPSLRFIVRVENESMTSGNDSCSVIDTYYKEYNMPERAVSLYMRETEARMIAEIMNKEWIHFINHPT